jgi:archaellum component FlaC
MTDISIAVAILAGVAGIVFGWLSAARANKKQACNDVAAFTRVQVTLETLTSKVDKIDVSLSGFTVGINGLDRRVGMLEARVEELTNALAKVKSPRRKVEEEV